jgi:hypothetical protein
MTFRRVPRWSAHTNAASKAFCTYSFAKNVEVRESTYLIYRINR